MKLYTIGFTKKTAMSFFESLKQNGIRVVIDIRLNNSSQLSGFAKGNDLEYFLKEICGISYVHYVSLAPTKDILDSYKNKKISWLEYENLFNPLLHKRDSLRELVEKYNADYDGLCLLCSEHKADNCHRRLVAEYIKENSPDLNIEIVHL